MTPERHEFLQAVAMTSALNAIAIALVATHHDKPALAAALKTAAQVHFDRLLEWQSKDDEAELTRAIVQEGFDRAFTPALRLTQG